MIIGLTGGIATGKSNVSQFLAKHGYSVVDADRITHQVQSKGQPGLKAIIDHFGHRYLTTNQTLDRHRLGLRVFGHPQALRELVRVIDPFIRKSIITELKRDEGLSDRVVLDAPTLFENGYQYLVDRIVVVACDPAVQLDRLRVRNGLSISDAVNRIKSQWPLSIKETLADVIINSNGTKEQTLNQVMDLIRRCEI